MDKVEFVIKNKKPSRFEFDEHEIFVIPYIPQNIKLDLAKKYLFLSSMNDNVIDNYYGSKWCVIAGIIENCTNIKFDGDNFESIISSGIWDEVKSRIINYDEFVSELNEIRLNEFEKDSIKQSINKVSNKFIELIDNISKIDLSEDGISKLTNKLQSVIKETEEKFPTSTKANVKLKKHREAKKLE